MSSIECAINNSKANPVIVKLPKKCDIKEIQDAIDMVRTAFFRVLINKTNIHRLKIFIPKGFDRLNLTVEKILNHYATAKDVKDSADGEHKKFVICNVFGFKIPDSDVVLDDNVEISDNAVSETMSVDECKCYAKGTLE